MEYTETLDPLDCPTAPDLDISYANVEKNSTTERIYGNTVLTMGVWANSDTDLGGSLSDPFVRPSSEESWINLADRWYLTESMGGVDTRIEMSVIAGDLMWSRGIFSSSAQRLNHPGSSDYWKFEVADGSGGFYSAYWQSGTVGQKAILDSTANYVKKDGSAATYKGEAADMVQVQAVGFAPIKYFMPKDN